MLLSLPFIVAGALFVMSPDYIDALFADARGQLVVAAAMGCVVIGAIWLKLLLKVKF
ncbi:MAG: hypothetical protein R2706_18070 [Acidimicrobiales bacterium]